MRKVVLSLVAVAAITIPGFAGESKYNKVGERGRQGPDVLGPARHPQWRGDQRQPVGHQGRRCGRGVPGQPLPRGEGRTRIALIEFTKDYKDKGVAVVGISVSQSRWRQDPGHQGVHEGAQARTTSMPMTRPRKSARPMVPRPPRQFFVLDKERKIRYIGAMDDNGRSESKVTKHYLRDAVNAVLAGKTPEVDRDQGHRLRHRLHEVT